MGADSAQDAVICAIIFTMVYVEKNDEDEGDILTGTRVCKKCGERKPMAEFHWSNGGKHRRRTCKACAHARHMELRRENPEKYRRKDRLQHVNRKYGLDEEAYDALILSSQGRCGICKREFTGIPHVDHDHETGRIRGVLCLACNTALGKFRDDVEILKSAIMYLERDEEEQNG